jgi:inhibitor of cysteine peptidase
MKKAAMILAILMALAAIFSGCGKTETVYGADDTSISVKAGDTFTIRLEANPTTGYEWAVTISDETVLALEKSDYVPDEVASDVAGSGGTQVFAFKALNSGEAAIDMVYQRSWEPQADDQHIKYTVTVN